MIVRPNHLIRLFQRVDLFSKLIDDIGISYLVYGGDKNYVQYNINSTSFQNLKRIDFSLMRLCFMLNLAGVV